MTSFPATLNHVTMGKRKKIHFIGSDSRQRQNLAIVIYCHTPPPLLSCCHVVILVVRVPRPTHQNQSWRRRHVKSEVEPMHHPRTKESKKVSKMSLTLFLLTSKFIHLILVQICSDIFLGRVDDQLEWETVREDPNQSVELKLFMSFLNISRYGTRQGAPLSDSTEKKNMSSVEIIPNGKSP